ncbi:arrestin domain-containing protein 17-like [Achroia grisella]|uniref:arrestin domain-containing protein 17-like n=1 Tax=Achroia grisella TaxID=688607 RepID=UPI0027D2F526|nr:arrestin domain-containing protein 17-like [Achroia grisella]
MGIFCLINVSKDGNDEFVAEDIVSGLIKYAVDENTTFKKITVSLKGIGRIRIINRQTKECPEFTTKEEYVDIDNVIVDNEVTLPIGEYETKFSFELPKDIPSSFAYCSSESDYYIKCKIYYYIRIKFDRPGILKLPVRYKKVFTVRPYLTPSLPKELTMYGKHKKIVKLFSGNNTISIKAGIENSVISGGETVKFCYEILNDTNVTIKGVQVKLVEAHKFKAKGLHSVKRLNKVEGTQSKTAQIKGGNSQEMDFQITIPTDKATLQHSKIAVRYYYINVKVLLPLLRQNFTLQIPIEVGNTVVPEVPETEDFEPPPSYWKTMDECKNSKLFDDDWTDDEL